MQICWQLVYVQEVSRVGGAKAPLQPRELVRPCHNPFPAVACTSSSTLAEHGLYLEHVLFCITCDDSGEDIVC
jgi:hypothetical protein